MLFSFLKRMFCFRIPHFNRHRGARARASPQPTHVTVREPSEIMLVVDTSAPQYSEFVPSSPARGILCTEAAISHEITESVSSSYVSREDFSAFVDSNSNFCKSVLNKLDIIEEHSALFTSRLGALETRPPSLSTMGDSDLLQLSRRISQINLVDVATSTEATSFSHAQTQVDLSEPSSVGSNARERMSGTMVLRQNPKKKIVSNIN